MKEEAAIWPLCKEAQVLCEELMNKVLERSSFFSRFEERAEKVASLALFDLIDFFRVDPKYRVGIEEAGFEKIASSEEIYHHPRAHFPLIQLSTIEEAVGISVESIEDFLSILGVGASIEGSPLSDLRMARVAAEAGVIIYGVERRRNLLLVPDIRGEDWVDKVMAARELWSLRPRSADEEESFAQAERRANEIVLLVGKARAASLIMERERHYWQVKNRAGQLQKARQDKLGIGWANHDHHTFRSSRLYFNRLVQLFEKVGFICRERFYAGKEAGWGAQVMEHPDIRLVLFLDVDLAPGEINIDFAHTQLPPLQSLGTIGLWCALHSDSILQAGMHHLEGQFDFPLLEKDLKELGISMMAPFSNFPYLQQAFTTGEIWPCDTVRVENIFSKGLITQAEKERFIQEGALGSHLENLHRKQGYKGFNQNNVSLIIKDTDPRTC